MMNSLLHTLSSVVTDPASNGTPLAQLAHPRDKCEQTWQHYVDAWSSPQPQQRLTHLQQALAPDFSYADKAMHITASYDEFVRHIGQMHEQYTGMHSETQKLYLYHAVGLADHTSVDGQGKVVLNGREYVEFAEDGRINRVQSFYETN